MPRDEVADVQRKILETFGEIASAIGYSPLHGQIIGVLLIKNRPVSLQELATETGYSVSMLSLSLDLLEVLGVVKKVKKSADRRLYLELYGDLLEVLKNAIMIRLGKSITSSLAEFDEGKRRLEKLSGNEKQQLVKSIEVLEGQIRRLETYVTLLSKMRLP